MQSDGWDDAEPKDGGVPQVEARLKAPSILTPGAAVGLVFALFLAAALWSLPDVGPVERAIILGFIAFLALSPLYFAWTIRRSAAPRTLALFSDHVRLPINARTTHRLFVRFPEVTGILLHEGSGSNGGFLLIGTGRFDFFYPLRSFRELGEARAFVDALKRTLRDALPHGHLKVEAFDAEGARTAEAMSRKPWALVAIALALFAGAAVQWAAGGFATAFSSVEFGALSRPLVWAGEWYRVGAHVFVQSTPLPVLADQNLPGLTVVLHAAALFVLGRPLERLLGSWFVAALFVAGTLVGAAFVVVANDAALLHGAGAAIFSFIGAMVFLSYVAKDRVPLGFRLSHRYWFWALILGIVVLFGNDLSFDAALGGLLAGALLVAPFASGPLPRRELPGWLSAVALVGAVLFVASFARAVQRAPEVGVDDLRPVIERSSDPGRLNYFAWDVALDDDPSESELELAELAARRGLEFLAQTPGAPAVRDTLATVYHRKGEHGRAVELQREVLEDVDNPVFASQLGRFMWAAHQADIPVSTSTTADIRLSGGLSDDGRVVVTPHLVRGELSRPVTAFAVVRDDGRIEGILRVGLDPGGVGVAQTLDTPEALTWTPSSTITVTRLEPGRTLSKAWAFAEEVREYP